MIIAVFHPGIPIHINKTGDLIVRPTYVESSLNHFWWKESVLDHLFPSYQKSVAAIMSTYPSMFPVSSALLVCPTLIDYVDKSDTDGFKREFEQNLYLTKGERRRATIVSMKKGGCGKREKK